MITAMPADHEIKRVLLDANDDLIDQGPHDALAGLPRHAFTAPCSIEVGAASSAAFDPREQERRSEAPPAPPTWPPDRGRPPAARSSASPVRPRQGGCRDRRRRTDDARGRFR